MSDSLEDMVKKRCSSYLEKTSATSVFKRSLNRWNVAKCLQISKTTASLDTSNPAHAYRHFHRIKQIQLHLFRPTRLRLNSGDDLYVVTLQSQENVHHSTSSYTVEVGIYLFFF